MSDVQTTTLGRNWLLKTILFTVLLLGFGCWGLVDALYFYPKRGEMDAARRLTDHLVAAEAAGMLSPSQLKVDDPAATLTALRTRRADLATRAIADTADGRAAKVEFTRLEWLDSLNRMWALRPEPRLVHTDKGPPALKYYFDMRTGEGYTLTPDNTKSDVPSRPLLAVLSAAANTSNNVTPLSGFDMLFQWIFVVIGFGGGLWMLIGLAIAAAKKYRWQPDTQTLTLHDGRDITPADLKEVDKRLWHKFFVTLHLKDGAAYKLDLLRYQPLEDWVLALERTAFPEQAAATIPVSAEAATSDTSATSPG